MSTVTVRSFDLHNMLKSALLFAGKDDTLPMLTCVKLELIGDYLVASTTDRFRLALIRIRVEQGLGDDTDGPFSVLLDRKQVAAALPALKTAVRDADWQKVVLTSEDKMVSWRQTEGVSGTFADHSADYQYPTFARLIQPDPGPVAESPQSSTVCLDSAYLADWAKAAWTKGASMIIEPGATNAKPVTIRIGTYLLGIQMPLRPNDNPTDSVETRASWADLLEQAS